MSIDQRVNKEMAKYQIGIISTSLQVAKEMNEMKFQRQINLQTQLKKDKASMEALSEEDSLAEQESMITSMTSELS